MFPTRKKPVPSIIQSIVLEDGDGAPVVYTLEIDDTVEP